MINSTVPIHSQPTQQQVDTFVAAAKRGDLPTVKTFVDKYPDAINHENLGDLPGAGGLTALYCSAANGCEEVIKFLLGNGAEVNKQTSAGMTPLMAAAFEEHIGIVDLLLEECADIDATDVQGSTALDMCRQFGMVETAAFLEQWPEIKKQRQAARELEAELAAVSPALKRPIRAHRPLGAKP